MQHLAKVMKRIIVPFRDILDNFARKMDERQSTVILTKTVLFMKNFTKLFCSAFLLLAGGVSASAQNDEIIDFDASFYHNWSEVSANATDNGVVQNGGVVIGEEVALGGVIWGDLNGSVPYLNYANITDYSELRFEGTPGAVIRLMCNRLKDEGPIYEIKPKIGEDGKLTVSISDLKYLNGGAACDFVCLQSIKVPAGWQGGTTAATITSIKIVKPGDPLANFKTDLKNAINAAKLQNSFAKTEASWNALQNAITDAEAALAAATDAASLNAAKNAVDAAVNGLTLLEGYSDLTKDMLFSWTGWDATAVKGNQAGCSYDLFTSTGQPYGDGSVIAFADLSEYDKLQIVSKGGTPRFLLNRDVDEGQWNENEAESHLIDNTKGDANSWHAKYFSQDGDVYTVDLAQLVADKGFAHLHAIKTVGGNVVVSGMYLYKAPEAATHTWDFTAWSDATISNLRAEAAKVTVEDDPENEGKTKCTMNGAFWSDHEKANKCDTYDASKNNCFWYVGGEAEPTANGEAIAELKGLVFDNTYGGARSLAIAVNYPETSLGTYEGPSYLWLGGKDKDCFTIKSVKVGSELVIAAESHKPAEARGIQLMINGEKFGDAFTPTTFAEKTWTITAKDDAIVVDVVVHNTNGCHLYYIDAEIDNTYTGIQTVTTTKENGAYYDLQGRRVAQPTKGLYILNGKKVMMK